MDFKTLARSPLIAVQALWVIARASRLPEAEGPREGEIGTGPSLSVLVLGDSSAAGVGVRDQSEALGGQVAAQLSNSHRVRWKVLAKSGATVKRMHRMLTGMEDESFDLVVIALGVNDVKNGVSAAAWERDYRDLLRLITDKFDAPFICASGAPAVRHFPLLPYPLSEALGARAEQFDVILRGLVEELANAEHLPMDFPLDPENMASDGFHPSAKLYQEWASRVARLFASANSAQSVLSQKAP